MMIAGRLICEKCGKDFTGGLWGFILGVGRGRTINATQKQQLEEFKKEFGKEQLVWCWVCLAKIFGAKTVEEQKAEEEKEQEKPGLPAPEKKEKTEKT
jgi:hypothetical protein